MQEQFIKDVAVGLSKPDKAIPSMYFYDAQGDELFVKIMASPEYYLTRSEMEILTTQTGAMIDAFEFDKNTPFELIEFGAGDGSKTIKLLGALLDQGYDFEYLPIDISQDALTGLKADMLEQLPALKIRARQGDYLQALDELKNNAHPKVVLFLGSNIGNLSDAQAADFIYQVGADLAPGDKLLLGVDLIKPVSVVLPAYNDKQGITSEFNLNLLRRMNNELGANFDLTMFEHVAQYNEEEGVARSFLRSKIDQTVTISALERSFQFRAGEKLKTEISRKYSRQVLEKILTNTNFEITHEFSDQKTYFSDFVLKRMIN